MGVGKWAVGAATDAVRWKMMSGADRSLQSRMYNAAALQHQSEQIKAEYRAPEEERRRAEAAEREAKRDYEKHVTEQKKILADQEKAAWAAWALEPRYTGGVDPEAPLIVTHHRSGKMPVLILPPSAAVRDGTNAVLSGPEEMVKARPDRVSDERFMEAARTADALYTEVRRAYGPLLAAMRDATWWRDLCVAAGVSMSSTSDHVWEGQYGSGKERITSIDIPCIAGVRVAGDGLRIRIVPRLGDTAERWRKAVPALRAGFKSAGAPAGEMSVHEDASGAVVIRLNDADPFEHVDAIQHVYDDERGRSLLGVTSTGQEAWITWRGSSGMVVGGVPGSGKTASMLPVFAAMKDECELHVFDGKSGFDLHPLRHIATTYDNSGDLAAPLATLRMLDDLRVQRAAALHAALGANNYWNLNRETRRRLKIKTVFLILDEVQTWLDQSGMAKDEKAIAEEIKRLIRTLIQKGRSTGIVVVLTTQKPDATSIPTIIRDNAALKLCFRVSTPEQAITVLGRQPANAPDPTTIPMAAKGRAVMETEGQGIVMLQSGYRDPDELDAELAGEQPVESQSDVAAGLLGEATEPEVEEPVAPPLTLVPAPPTAAQAPLDVSALTEDQRQALLAQLLAQPVVGSGESAVVHGAEPLATARDPEPPTAPAPEPPPAQPSRKPRRNDTPAF